MSNIRYTKEHEWLRLDGDIVTVSAAKRGLIINGVEVDASGEPLGSIGGVEPPSHAVH